MGSTQVVSKVKWLTKQKCGHLGTLDPMASGVLPVAVGKATKLFDYFLSKDKEYFAISKFGIETDTLDSEGKIVRTSNKVIQKTQIDKVIPQFLGKIDQIPPKYSSVKVSGAAAYQLARAGKNIKLPSRKVEIYNLACQKLKTNLFAFKIHCSAGTYVRSLVSDIAKAVGSVATTVCIIRTRSGKFDISNSSTLQELESGNVKLVSVAEVVDLPKIVANNEQCQKLLAGQTIETTCQDGDYLCYYNSNALGIVQSKDKQLKVKINLWEYSND